MVQFALKINEKVADLIAHVVGDIFPTQISKESGFSNRTADQLAGDAKFKHLFNPQVYAGLFFL